MTPVQTALGDFSLPRQGHIASEPAATESSGAKPSQLPDQNPASIVSLSADAAKALEMSGHSEAAPANKPLQAAHTGPELEARLQKGREMLMISSVRVSPEGAAALREALSRGTVRTQRAEDVPGVGYRTLVEYGQTATGPYEKHTQVGGKHSPAIQAAIDAGKALAMWQRGIGDVYLTWD